MPMNRRLKALTTIGQKFVGRIATRHFWDLRELTCYLCGPWRIPLSCSDYCKRPKIPKGNCRKGIIPILLFKSRSFWTRVLSTVWLSTWLLRQWTVTSTEVCFVRRRIQWRRCTRCLETERVKNCYLFLCLCFTRLVRLWTTGDPIRDQWLGGLLRQKSDKCCHWGK